MTKIFYNQQDTITTETRYRGTLSIWIEDPQSDTHDPLISRDGKWYTIESFTTTEQSFNVSESFSPTNNNGNISLTAEDPFAPVTLSFDFFRTDSFAVSFIGMGLPGFLSYLKNNLCS